MKAPLYTEEKLASFSVSKRHELYKNALVERANGNPEAQKIIDLLISSGLPYSESGGLSADDPVTIKIWGIVNSGDGIAAMKSAVAKGLPPMAGVDPLLSAALGVDYGGHNTATATAGDFVANKMRQLGFKDTGKQRDMPQGCVAKSARFFTE